jgi:multiple sugar transport system permease protein
MAAVISSKVSEISLAGRLARKFEQRNVLARALVMPSVVVLFVVAVIPTLYVFVLAFSQYKLGSPLLSLTFVGFKNFLRAFSDNRFWHGLGITCVFAIPDVAIQLVLGFAIAMALQRVGPLTRRVAITVSLIPMMLVPALVGLLGQLLFHETYGPINHVLVVLGLPPANWLSDPTAMTAALMIADVWEWTPFATILLLAGLQSMSQEVLEAAHVDGAGAWQSLRHITLPLLKPFIFLAVFLRMVDAWKAYDLVANLPPRGAVSDMTESLAYYTWKVAFGVSADRGLGAAMSVFQLIIIIILGKFLVSQLSRVARGD